MFTAADRLFIEAQPVARLATSNRDGVPHAVPICFALIEDKLYVTIDEKPKRPGKRPLKRIRNIEENPRVCVIIDRYRDDWTKLGWVMLHGLAGIIDCGDEHGRAQAALQHRYPQYRDMRIAHLPVIAIGIERVARWGNLEVDP